MATTRPIEEIRALEAQALESERRRAVAECLRGILTVLNSNRPLDEILNYIVGEAMRLLDADAAAIYRLLPEEKILSIQSARGLDPEYVAHGDIRLGQLATGRAVELRQPVPLSDFSSIASYEETIEDAEQARLIQKLAEQFHSLLSVPLVIKNNTVGALTLYYAAQRAFSHEDIDLAVAFCDQSALAIENARLREKSQEDAIAAERNRLARELHDSVTQMLFSASLITEVLPSVWKRSPEEAQLALTELRQLTHGALAEMRALLLELRPDGLQDARLEDLLRQLAQAMSGRLHTPVRCAIEGHADLPREVQLALYRIAQEAFNNITKHSAANQVEISLTGIPGDGSADHPRGVILLIQDDGLGFDPRQVTADHLGLSIMRERASSIGADICINSRPGAGTHIQVTWLSQA